MNVSKKVLNLLTTINILFATICNFYFISKSLFCLDTKIDKEIYSTCLISSLYIFLPVILSIILSHLRQKISTEGQFIIKKDDIIFFIVIFIFFFIIMLVYYFFSMFSIDYCILKFEAFKAFPLARPVTYVMGIFLEIFFIYLNFISW